MEGGRQGGVELLHAGQPRSPPLGHPASSRDGTGSGFGRLAHLEPSEPANAQTYVRCMPQFVVGLGKRLAPTDVEEGMRVGIDHQRLRIQIPVPTKLDSAVSMMQAGRGLGGRGEWMGWSDGRAWRCGAVPVCLGLDWPGCITPLDRRVPDPTWRCRYNAPAPCPWPLCCRSRSGRMSRTGWSRMLGLGTCRAVSASPERLTCHRQGRGSGACKPCPCKHALVFRLRLNFPVPTPMQ